MLALGWLLALGVAVQGCGDSSFFDDSDSDDVPAVEPEDSADDSEDDEDTGDDEDSEREYAAIDSEPALDSEPPRDNPHINVPARTGTPIRSWLTEEDDVAVENRLDVKVPFVAYVYVHSGGVLLGRTEGARTVDGLPPGETRFQPAPKETPERVKDQMEQELIDHGFSEQRARDLMQQHGDDLFEEHGARAVYIAPEEWWTERPDRVAFGGADAPVPPWRR